MLATPAGLSDRDVSKYSLPNMALETLKQIENGRVSGRANSLETEASNTIAAALGRIPRPGRFFVPLEAAKRQRRDLVAGAGSAGHYVVGTQNLTQNFEQALYGESRCLEAGVMSLPGMVDDITVPRGNNVVTTGWHATEGSTHGAASPTFGQLTGTPKSLSADLPCSNQFLKNIAANGNDGLLWGMLAVALGAEIDRAIIAGSGASGEPLGLLVTSGVGSVAGASMDFAKVREFQTDAGVAKSLKAGFSYMTNSTTASVLMGKQRFSGTDSPLWEGAAHTGTMAGCVARSTENVPAGVLIGGSFSGIALADWGGMELAIDPFTDFRSGKVTLRVWVMVDVLVLIPTAFSVATGIS